MTASIDQQPLRYELYAALERYFVLKDRDPGFVLQSTDAFEFDGRPAYLPEILARGTLHDEDYRVFRFLTNTDEVFLDIGANYGYSAASVWATGAKCAVLSFEPIVAFEPCLKLMASLRPGRYDYRMMGLGASPARVRFVTPVINHTAVTALTTATESPHLESVAINLERYVHDHMGATQAVSLRFFEFEAHIEALDGVLARNHFSVPVNRVAAVKIDTEGFEFSVARGAAETLRKHRPLVMVEGGNRVPGLGPLMADLGYFYAERDGDVLRPFLGTGVRSNGFFVHRDRATAYRTIGLLAANVVSA